MDVASGFIPGAKCAGGNILLYAFLRAAKKGQLPIMNAACAIGGQVRHPAVGDQFVHDALRAIFYQVSAV